MHLLRLCETQEYSPQLLEHWLCTMQKSRTEMELTFLEKDGRVQILSGHDLSPHFLGGRSVPHKKPFLKNGKKHIYCVYQKKGPLLPIKRSAQFEDRVNKERIFPADSLLQLMVKYPSSFISYKFRPVTERKRHRALKKAKKVWFRPDHKLDQWESKVWFLSWFQPRLRKILCPPLRKILTQLAQISPFGAISAIGTIGAAGAAGRTAAHATQRETQEQTQSMHEREDPRTAVLDKLSRPLFQVTIEMSHPFQNFIHGFTLPYLGELDIKKIHVQKKPQTNILSAEELSSLASFPNPKTCAAYLHTESTAYFPPPENPLQISESDRRRHLYLLGKTGMGKSTLMLNLLKQDLQANHSIILLDPHGDLIEDALKLIPPEKSHQTILIDPSLIDAPLALNPVELRPNESPALKASALIEMFEALAKGSWGPRLEYILRATLLTLILSPNTTLLDLPRLLTNPGFCQEKLSQIHDLELLRFWQEEFLPQDARSRQEQIAPILNKVGPLITSPLLRNIFGQPRGKFNFEQTDGKIILIPLSKGKLGEDASRMLGMIFISMIQSTLLQRANLPLENRQTIALYIDEFQNFTTPTLISMLSESRKYGLALTIANQYLTQLRPEIQDAVLGNVGSLFAFRLSFQDAQIVAPTLGLTEEDLTNLAPFQAYAKLLKNSQPLPLFRLETPMLQTQAYQKPHPALEKIKLLSRERYSRKRELVEQKIQERYNMFKFNRAK